MSLPTSKDFAPFGMKYNRNYPIALPVQRDGFVLTTTDIGRVA